MLYKKNILETIGKTPLIRLNKITKEIPALVLAKVETFNPGHSIKDRIAVKMIDDAEARGDLKPGGTIIECTSGNTGMGLALVASVRGYRCIFTTTDKQSKEKLDILKAFGAEVIVCPTNVEPEDPRSYYSMAEKINKQLPNSFWCNQYDNLSNREAHYETTGPEIWEQTEGKITHLVVGVGTGGTISGTAKYLKEQNPAIKVWGIDTYGSVFKKYHESGIFDKKEIYPYITEGIGEDIIPNNVDFELIDHFEKVSDGDGALVARKLARDEGILVGYSAGSTMAGLLQLHDNFTDEDIVVIIFHDHGSRYVGKIFNDDWMRDRGFLEREWTVGQLVNRKAEKTFYSVKSDDRVRTVLHLMKEHDISQLPVTDNGNIVGSITETNLLNFILENPVQNTERMVKSIMGTPFPLIDLDTPVDELTKLITRESPAILILDKAGEYQILTKYDIIHAL